MNILWDASTFHSGYITIHHIIYCCIFSHIYIPLWLYYNSSFLPIRVYVARIYIPLWLYYNHWLLHGADQEVFNLHSTLVILQFILAMMIAMSGCIYIPLWLYYNQCSFLCQVLYAKSTFHSGYITMKTVNGIIMHNFIYIPLWLYYNMCLNWVTCGI